jgi:hypothetical protein
MADLRHDETPQIGVYLYCLARLECLSVLQASVGADLLGVDERYPVVALVDSGVVAVITEVNITDFSEENLKTLSWVGERACRHEAVVERVMTVSPVLPVKFGTIYRSRASLKQFLDQCQRNVETALDNFRDKSEWSIKGYLVEEDAKRIIASADPGIQSRIAALSTSPGARYLQQKQLDAAVNAALEAGLVRMSHDLQQSLALHAVAATTLRLHASAVTGRPDRMVFNSSFLLSSETLADFRAALSDQQDAYNVIGLTLELRGPWPPYNFCPNLAGS